jgi:hypothetical protein
MNISDAKPHASEKAIPVYVDVGCLANNMP